MASIKARVAIKTHYVWDVPLAVLGGQCGCPHANAPQFHVLEKRHCKLLLVHVLPALETLGSV